jgi:hypothetical protein
MNEAGVRSVAVMLAPANLVGSDAVQLAAPLTSVRTQTSESWKVRGRSSARRRLQGAARPLHRNVRGPLLSAATLALTASELGPGWSRPGDPIRGDSGGLDTYAVVYENVPAIRAAAVTVIGAARTDVAERALTTLQHSYGAEGVAFSNYAGMRNAPAVKGTRTKADLLEVFYLFRVNLFAATLQVMGPVQQECDIQADALRYASAQLEKIYTRHQQRGNAPART